MKAGFSSIVLWLAIALLILGLAVSGWKIYSYYKAAAASAVADHKKILINIASDEPETAATDGSAAAPENTAATAPEKPADNAAKTEEAAAAAAPSENAGGGGGTGGVDNANNAAATAETPQPQNPPVATKEDSAVKDAPAKEPVAETPATETKPAVITPATPAPVAPEAKTATPAATAAAEPAKTAAAPEAPAKPKIAIIVTGLALSKSSTLEAMKLPPQISFSFSPYAANLPEWFQAAKTGGHEILLDLPMEPNDYPITDPGPYALLTSLSKEENIARLNSLLALGDTNLSGLVAGRDEKFSSSVDNLAAVLTEIKSHNLRLYFSSKNSSSPVFAFSNSFEVPVFLSDVIIDDKITESAIQGKLAELEKIALAKGAALGVARPYPLTVKQLALWAATLDAKGIKLVPASEIGAASKNDAAEIKK